MISKALGVMILTLIFISFYGFIRFIFLIHIRNKEREINDSKTMKEYKKKFRIKE